MPDNKKPQREQYIIKIGPLLRNLLNKQKKIIKEATYDCITSSDYDVGEIIAKKVSENI